MLHLPSAVCAHIFVAASMYTLKWKPYAFLFLPLRLMLRCLADLWSVDEHSCSCRSGSSKMFRPRRSSSVTKLVFLSIIVIFYSQLQISFISGAQGEKGEIGQKDDLGPGGQTGPPGPAGAMGPEGLEGEKGEPGTI